MTTLHPGDFIMHPRSGTNNLVRDIYCMRVAHCLRPLAAFDCQRALPTHGHCRPTRDSSLGRARWGRGSQEGWRNGNTRRKSLSKIGREFTLEQDAGWHPFRGAAPVALLCGRPRSPTVPDQHSVEPLAAGGREGGVIPGAAATPSQGSL